MTTQQAFIIYLEKNGWYNRGDHEYRNTSYTFSLNVAPDLMYVTLIKENKYGTFNLRKIDYADPALFAILEDTK